MVPPHSAAFLLLPNLKDSVPGVASDSHCCFIKIRWLLAMVKGVANRSKERLFRQDIF
jgi:hypothetical protein